MKKRWMMRAAAAILALTAALGAAEGEGVVVQSSCNVVQSGEYYLVYCYAQVHNASDEVISLEQGLLELHSGDQLLSVNEIGQIWPYFINPGEEGYLFDIVSFEPNEDGVVIPQVTGLAYQLDYMTVDTAYANFSLQTAAQLVQEEGSNRMSVICEVENTTQMDAYDPTVTFGLYTESGAMIYADGKTLYDVGIPVGGKMLVRFDVDEAFVEQWKNYNAMPAGVRVSATFRRDED